MTFKTGAVTTDDTITFRATYDPELRWNGWLGAPLFDRDEVERVIAWASQDLPFNGPYHEFEWDGDVLVHRDMQYYDEETDDDEGVERIKPDAEGRYSVGAFAWTWSEVDDDEAVQS